MEGEKRKNPATSARGKAIRQLIENHPKEWNDLLGDARVAAGLNRNGNDPAARKRAQIAKAEEKLAKLRAELADVEIGRASCRERV